MKPFIILATALIAISLATFPMTANAAAVSIGIANQEARAGGTVQVPVSITDGAGVGGLDFVIAYDPGVLSVRNVTAGSLNKGIVEANTSVPGLIFVSLADPAGMNGPGSVVTVTFQVTGQAGHKSDLILSNLQAFDANTLEELPVEATGGTFTVSSTGSGKDALSLPAAGSDAIFLVSVAMGLGALISRRKRGDL